MKGDGSCFIGRKSNAQPALDQIQRKSANQVLFPVKGTNLPQKRIAKQHLLLIPLDCKIDMIRQREINVMIQFFIHNTFCILDHLCGNLEPLRRKLLDQALELIHNPRIVETEYLLDQLVWNIHASPELEANALSHNDHFPSVFQCTDHVVVNHFFNFHTCPHQYQPVFNDLICFYIIRQYKRNKKTNSEQISAIQNIVQNWSCLPYSNNPICCYSNHVILMLP